MSPKHAAVAAKTLTWYRGMELADHQTITQATGVQIFLADPLSPSQSRTNENTNGLICQYLPKKTNLAKYSQADLDQIAHELNTRPCKCLDYRTPNEVEQPGIALTIWIQGAYVEKRQAEHKTDREIRHILKRYLA